MTPRTFFAALHAAVRFTVDAAATHDSALLPRYWTPETDALAQDWNGERVWCNPPYSDVGPWAAKAQAQQRGVVVMLVPANRTDQQWWHTWVEPRRDCGGPLRVYFVRGRLRFHPVRDVPARNEQPTFGSVLLVWSHEDGAYAAHGQVNAALSQLRAPLLAAS